MNYIRELHKGVQEIFNPFPTIAVWAAVKFVHKKEQNRYDFQTDQYPMDWNRFFNNQLGLIEQKW